MWNNQGFWRRLVAILVTATEEGHLGWKDTPEEPTFRAIFADGMIHLMLPEEGGWPPEVVAFDRWHIKVGVFRPEQADDVTLVERLYRLVERTCHPFEEPYPLVAREGELIELQPVLRGIEAELTKTKGGKGTVGATGRR